MTISVPVIPAIVIKNQKALKVYMQWKGNQKQIKDQISKSMVWNKAGDKDLDDAAGWELPEEDEESRAMAQSMRHPQKKLDAA